jgi:hypothetical protein
MNAREAFEAWWSDPAAPEGPLFTTEQHCWQAWQAATAVERERLKAQEVAHHREVQEQVAAERERCAKVCEGLRDIWVDGSDQWGNPCPAKVRVTVYDCAAAIRKGPTP